MVIMKSNKKAKFSLAEQSRAAEESADGDGGGGDDKEEIPKEIRVIAQEVKIVQSLACNDLNKRNRQMLKLRKWLQLRARSSFAFEEDDFARIWKGLYYNMWMSDKPLVQEELAEQLAQLLDSFDGAVETSVMFFGAFLQIMCQQWFGIDQWRIDKFLMLVRRMLRSMFRVLQRVAWAPSAVDRFSAQMLKTVLAEDISATGLSMHFLDIFFEELAKVSAGDISAEQVGAFLRPFVTFVATQRDFKLISHCRTRVFYHLLYQSALGREYTEKYNAWKDMGFPTKSIDELEKEEPTSQGDEEEGEDEAEQQTSRAHLDPRAGNVDVFMPELPLDGKYVIEALEIYIYKRDSTTKCRKMLKKLLETFQTYQNGEFPLGVKTMPRFERQSEKPLMKEKLRELENLENEVFGTGRKLKLLTKSKRRKLLKSLNFENVDEGSFDQFIEKSLPKEYLKERRKRAKAALMNGWLEEEISEEELGITPKKRQKKALQEEGEPQNKISGKKTKKVVAESNMSIANEPKKPKFEKTAKPITPKKPAAAVVEEVKTVTSTKKPQVTTAKKVADEWNEPLAEGETEYFIPSRKLQLKRANSDLVLNPAAKKAAVTATLATPTTPKAVAASVSAANTPKATPSSGKRVKIVLKRNTAQNPSEYIKQIKSSPNLPYDASKKPGKGLLKPNSMPSPINPFYKKKIGLRLLNDSI